MTVFDVTTGKRIVPEEKKEEKKEEVKPKKETKK